MDKAGAERATAGDYSASCSATSAAADTNHLRQRETENGMSYFLLIGFIASLWETSNSKTGDGASGSSTSGNPAVSLSEVKGTGKQYGGIEITGIIENKTSRTLDRMFVRYSIFDKQGNKVSEASDFIAQLEPSGTWKFSATSSAKEAETFSLDGISCKHGGLLVEEK